MNYKLGFVITTAAIEIVSSVGPQAAELPVPCVAGACGPSAAGFVTSGQATATASGNLLNVNQTSDRAILNWSSFNVGSDGRVVFKQPDSSSVALNRIFQSSPSRIFGALEANGQVYLINQNGIVFGGTAQVKTAGLLASTLDITPDIFNAGILSALQNSQPALKAAVDANGNAVAGDLVVQSGARITTSGSGGRILLAAPNVDNAGTINAPDGQVVLAAGEQVYLAASSDPKLRGLVVEVNGGGDAANRLTGDISAAHGNVTLLGLAVNQQGRISATTSVSANGSIRLLARDTVSVVGGTLDLQTHRTGSVELGAQSSTTVLPDLADAATAVDDQAQNPSQVDIMGRQVILRGGSRIVAPGGNVNIAALQDPSAAAGGYDAGARIRMESGAVIDVSGSTATLPAARNLVAVELRANELKDSPVQRDGALRGQTVVVDVRTGTPLADVSGAIAATPKGIAERTANGGHVAFNSQGDVGVASGATVDVSGGRIVFQPGVIQTSQLVGADGEVVDIGSADPNKEYVAVLNPTYTITYDRWGVKQEVLTPTAGRFDPGYTQGADAGTLQFAAPNLVLNGSFKGSVYIGPLQRDPTSAPLGGTFIVGAPDGTSPELADYRAPSVTFVQSAPDILLDDDTALTGSSTLELSTDFLTNGGFRSTRIYSNGVVTLPATTPLNLASGSSVSVLARRVEVEADIIALGGTIRLGSDRTADIAGVTPPQPGVSIGAGVTLDVSGQWTNDGNGQTSIAPIYRDAGTIELGASSYTDAGGIIVPSALRLGAGVSLLADGGAWLKANNGVAAGKGGTIALRSGQPESVFGIGDDVRLEAYGVQGAAGGKLVVEAGRVDIVHDELWARAQQFDPEAAAGPAALQLGDELFSGHGFSSFDIAATGATSPASGSSTLVVKSGSRIDTRTDVLVLDDGFAAHAGGGSISGFSHRLTPLEYTRPGSTLSLRTNPQQQQGIGGLTVEDDTVIAGAARSTFNFVSVGGVSLLGRVETHGGTINARIPTPTDRLDTGYQPDLRIDVGSAAVLDVSGVALLRPDADVSLRQGTVLAGGAVNLVAERGSVAVQSGALIDVSGTATALELKSDASAAPYQRQMVASAGGAVDLRAAESILLAGDLEAQAGVGDGPARAAAGSLAIELTRTLSGDAGLAATFPTAPRVVRVIPDTYTGTSLSSGQAIVDVGRIEASGIDSLTLRASDSISDSQSRVAFDAGVELNLGRQLIVDSALVDIAAGAPVKLSAPYVAFGSTIPGVTATDAPAGFGQLEVRGDDIELVGALALQHVGSALFSSEGDLQLRGIVNKSASTGSLRVGGDLTLAAARIYPTTVTGYSINVQGGASNTLRIAQSGSSPGTPLSADGSLHLVADRIIQGGTLLAPFGSIALDATQSVQLLPGSVTSVSANDALIPFGSVLTGSSRDWVYSFGTNPVSRPGIPDRAVEISAPDVGMAAGATVDLRGGGDLYAYTFVPGTGGSKDALAAGQTPGLYAVIPGLKGQPGPNDAQEYTGSDLKPGDSVYLSGVEGLAAGVYTLLPARYALLPGAYLVHAVSGYTDLQPGARITLADGSTVVAGYRTFGNTGIGDTRYSGFAVSPGSEARRLATYEDSFASSFFPAQAAKQGDTGRVAIPADAGSLSIAVQNSLTTAASVLSSAADHGRGAAIDISATNLEVTDAPGNAAAGIVQLDTGVLADWNPGSLLLGGRRTQQGGSIEVQADSVTFASGTDLALDELIAVARNEITLAPGAQVGAHSASDSSLQPSVTDTNLQLTGDAAILAVSDTSHFVLARDGASVTGGGHVTLAAGAELATRGALFVDAPNGADLDGTLAGDGAKWDLGSRHLTFADQTVADGITLTPSLVAALERGSSVRFASSGAIDFLSSTSIGSATNVSAAPLGSLTLSAASLRALDPSIQIDLAAKSVRLVGVGTDATAAPGSGAATLHVTAQNLQVASGNGAQAGVLDIGGFAATTLSASQVLATEGAVTVRTAGALDLSAGRVTTTTAADAVIQGGGIVRVTGTGSDPGAGGTPQLGGALAISGQQLEVSGRIVMPSGLLSLHADTQLSILGGGLLDVSGVNQTAGGRTVGTPGGTIAVSAGSDLTAARGSILRVGGAGTANGGTLAIRASGAADVNSTLAGSADPTARGARLLVDAGALSDFNTFAGLVQAGGFGEQQSYHVAQGDLDLFAGASLSARQVALTTDAGSIHVSGSITADSANQRGAIDLYASQDVVVGSGAVLRAEGTGGLGRGGVVTLGSTNGSVSVAGGSLLDTAGAAENGHVLLRAAARNNDVAVDQLAGTISGVDYVAVEPVLAYDAVRATLTSADLATYQADLSNYVANAESAIRARLTPAGGTPLLIQPGLELRRDGDLTISGDADFSGWRFGSDAAAGAITFRASGNLAVVGGTLSDGFAQVGAGAGARLELLAGRSSTLRFAAGAALSSANPLAVVDGGNGDVSFQDAIVRTGTGDLLVNAAHDIRFSTTADTAAASVYTGGQLDPDLPAYTNLSTRQFIAFPTHGGALSLRAGHDIVGNDVNESVSEWQRRVGQTPGSAAGAARWGIDALQFRWNAGTFGGGDLTLQAGHDVLDLAAAAADSGQVQSAATLRQLRGGVMTVDAGNDIGGSMFHLTAGVNRLTAGGSFARTRPSVDGTQSLGSVLSIGDAGVDLAARGDAYLETAFNPTVLRQMRAGLPINAPSYFFTYGDASSLDIQSLTGSVAINPAQDNIRQFIGDTVADAGGAIGTIMLLPPTLNLRALSGDVMLAGEHPSMFASDAGQLDIFAARDVVSNAYFTMSDAPASAQPTALEAQARLSTDYTRRLLSARHLGDLQPVLISAGRDIVGGGNLIFPKSARLVADRDVLELSLDNQNLNPTDATLIWAGRDVKYTTANGQIQLAGPGRLDVVAGRDIDLAYSHGITTTGTLTNPNIPGSRGADLTLLAGAKQALDPGSFLQQVVDPSNEYRAMLVSYVESARGETGLGYNTALAEFRTMSTDQQRPLLVQIFFRELALAGREANTDPTTDFARGYTAIDSLFPGSRATGTGAASPYSGDVLLAFSRLYTLGGGGISLLAPGGHVDVGLAVPPPGAPKRTAAELGIVAQGAGDVDIFASGDVLVNSSRVFTLGGGNIAIWSTTGDIDAGRGAKSAVSAPAPTITVDDKGNVSVNFAGAVAGSGIRAIVTNPAVRPGDVDLIAPAGIVNAGDAGIGSAGNLNVAARQVVGLDNIQVGGSSTGVPSDVSSLGASLSGVSAVASSASASSSKGALGEEANSQPAAPLAASAISWLDVFVEGFGEEACKPNDAECLKRNTKR